MENDGLLKKKRRIDNKDGDSRSLPLAAFLSGPLAYKALSVVLQHWLIPDLRINLSIFNFRLPKLREEVVEIYFNSPLYNHRHRGENQSDTEFKAHITTQLLNRPGNIDTAVMEELQQELQETHVLRSYLRSQISFSSFSDVEDRDSINRNVIVLGTEFIFTHYYLPIMKLLQHASMTQAMKTFTEYQNVYCHFIEWFHEQQTKHAGRESLIAYQLSSFQSWNLRMEIIRLTLVRFSLMPMEYLAQYNLIHDVKVNTARDSRRRVAIPIETAITGVLSPLITNRLEWIHTCIAHSHQFDQAINNAFTRVFYAMTFSQVFSAAASEVVGRSTATNRSTNIKWLEALRNMIATVEYVKYGDDATSLANCASSMTLPYENDLGPLLPIATNEHSRAHLNHWHLALQGILCQELMIDPENPDPLLTRVSLFGHKLCQLIPKVDTLEGEYFPDVMSMYTVDPDRTQSVKHMRQLWSMSVTYLQNVSSICRTTIGFNDLQKKHLLEFGMTQVLKQLMYDIEKYQEFKMDTHLLEMMSLDDESLEALVHFLEQITEIGEKGLEIVFKAVNKLRYQPFPNSFFHVDDGRIYLPFSTSITGQQLLSVNQFDCVIAFRMRDLVVASDYQMPGRYARGDIVRATLTQFTYQALCASRAVVESSNDEPNSMYMHLIAADHFIHLTEVLRRMNMSDDMNLIELDIKRSYDIYKSWEANRSVELDTSDVGNNCLMTILRRLLRMRVLLRHLNVRCGDDITEYYRSIIEMGSTYNIMKYVYEWRDAMDIPFSFRSKQYVDESTDSTGYCMGTIFKSLTDVISVILEHGTENHSLNIANTHLELLETFTCWIELGYQMLQFLSVIHDVLAKSNTSQSSKEYLVNIVESITNEFNWIRVKCCAVAGLYGIFQSTLLHSDSLAMVERFQVREVRSNELYKWLYSVSTIFVENQPGQSLGDARRVFVLMAKRWQDEFLNCYYEEMKQESLKFRVTSYDDDRALIVSIDNA